MVSNTLPAPVPSGWVAVAGSGVVVVGGGIYSVTVSAAVNANCKSCGKSTFAN